MGFLDRLTGGGAADDDAGQARREASIAAIEAGGLPLTATDRLRELAGSPDPLFTSNLSVADFAIGEQHRLDPVCSVMGSSIYKVGWNFRPWGASGVMQAQTDALNHARSLALSRLRQEAELAGADAVVEVRIERGEHDFAGGAIEFIAQGTAVRDPLRRGDGPGGAIITDLSVADLHLLRLSGHEPVGVAAASTVYYVYASWATQRAQGGWLTSMRNQELTDFTAGIYSAREIALANLQQEAIRAGGEGVVGVELSQHIRPYEVDSGGSKRRDLIVTFEILGTAIRATERPSLTVQPIVPLGVRR